MMVTKKACNAAERMMLHEMATEVVMVIVILMVVVPLMMMVMVMVMVMVMMMMIARQISGPKNQTTPHKKITHHIRTSKDHA